MMSGRKAWLTLCGATLIACAGLSQAQETATGTPGGYTAEDREAIRAKMQERYEQMSPEEREAMREAIQERRDAMTPEERDAIREKIRERRDALTPEEREAHRAHAKERFEAMSPEEQEAVREKMRERRENHYRHHSGDRDGPAEQRRAHEQRADGQRGAQESAAE